MARFREDYPDQEKLIKVLHKSINHNTLEEDVMFRHAWPPCIHKTIQQPA